MNFLQRLISSIVPPAPACGHEATITNLTARLQVALIEVDNANARTRGAVAFCGQLEKEIAAAHPPSEEYVDALQSLRLQRERAEADLHALVRAQEELEITSREIVVLRRRIDEQNREAASADELNFALVRQLKDQVRDLTGQLEETTGTIAVLESRVRELGGGEQLALVSTDREPSSDEKAADPEDEEVSNKILPLAWRMVGIFFDTEGPGRKHSWLFERGGERAKVPIADAEFIKSVNERKQSFGAGDTLLGDFHVITWRRKTDGEIRVEYRSIDKVTRIVHPDEPLSLDLKPEPEVAHV